MTRRTEVVTITEENRDHGKSFLLTEMTADKAERWAVRALTHAMQNGAPMPPGMVGGQGLSLAGLAAVGVFILVWIPYEKLEPMLEEAMRCVQFVVGDKIKPQPIHAGNLCQIHEVSTFVMLRKKLWELHLGFSMAEVSQDTPLSSETTSPAS